LRADLSPVALIARPLGATAQGDGAPPSMPLVEGPVPPRAGHVGIFVSEAVRALYDASPGQLLSLPLVPGQPPVAALVRGVWRDYAHQQGAIVMDEADYRRLTGDAALNSLALWLAPDAATPDVQSRIRQAAAAQGVDGASLRFNEPREIRQTTLRIFDRSFAVTYWLQAVAIGIGLFGIAARLSAQVLARREGVGLR